MILRVTRVLAKAEAKAFRDVSQIWLFCMAVTYLYKRSCKSNNAVFTNLQGEEGMRPHKEL
jgi:hypothetical protein